MSLDLFNYYREMILRELEVEKGLKVGRQNITNLRYADDTVLLAKSVEDLQKLLDVVVRESELKGLLINCKKTECMVVSKKRDIPRCSLKVKDQIINQVSAFNYLGSTITEDARCMKEIKKRIVLAKSAFSKLNNILRNTSLSMRTRMQVLNYYVYPVLLYGSKTWSITSDMRKHLESCEMWFLRRMMRIPWTDKVRNEEVLQRAGAGMKLILEIRTKQMRFLGHLMRKDGLENLALTGKIEGKRSRGRQQSLWTANLNEWIGERGLKYQEVALFEKARDRELWKSMIDHIIGYGT